MSELFAATETGGVREAPQTDLPFADYFNRESIAALWAALKKDKDGLVVSIVMDEDDGKVLMQAFQDEEAFGKSLSTAFMHYHSRSRGRLWLKGESSGHYQQILRVQVDCDADCLLYTVRQSGAACHTGARSCFYRDLAELI